MRVKREKRDSISVRAGGETRETRVKRENRRKYMNINNISSSFSLLSPFHPHPPRAHDLPIFPPARTHEGGVKGNEGNEVLVPRSHHVAHVRTRAIGAAPVERLLGSCRRRDTLERGATGATRRTTLSAMRDNIASAMVPSRHKSPETAAGTVASAHTVCFE